MVLWVKPRHGTLASHFKAPIWVPATQLLIQLPADTSQEAEEDGPQAWASATQGETQVKLPRYRLMARLLRPFGSKSIDSLPLFLSLCPSNRWSLTHTHTHNLCHLYWVSSTLNKRLLGSHGSPFFDHYHHRSSQSADPTHRPCSRHPVVAFLEWSGSCTVADQKRMFSDTCVGLNEWQESTPHLRGQCLTVSLPTQQVCSHWQTSHRSTEVSVTGGARF